MINTIIFDLDDTLYKELDFVYGGFGEVCLYLAHKYHKDERILYKDMLNILNKQGRGKIFNVLCKNHNIKEPIDTLVKIYRESKPKINLYKDAEFILCHLRNNNKYITGEQVYNIGIITDGKASVQWNKIKLLGLDKIVDKIIVTDDYGPEFWKPNDFAYREMLKYFNVIPKQCMYVGDNPNKDFIGAKKIGINTARIIREIGDHMKIFLNKEYEADININSLDELKNILKNSMGEAFNI